jgi:hypothetical protein
MDMVPLTTKAYTFARQRVNPFDTNGNHTRGVWFYLITFMPKRYKRVKGSALMKVNNVTKATVILKNV